MVSGSSKPSVSVRFFSCRKPSCGEVETGTRVQRFVAAMEEPTAESLRALFAADAVHVSDGGGLARATLRPLHGVERLVRLYLQLASNLRGVQYRTVMLNGEPALLMHDGERVLTAIWIESDGERITTIHSLRHPGKLARLMAVTNAQASASLH